MTYEAHLLSPGSVFRLAIADLSARLRRLVSQLKGTCFSLVILQMGSLSHFNVTNKQARGGTVSVMHLSQIHSA